MVTFSEISPSELVRRYQNGSSISEIAADFDRSYSFVRKRLLKNAVVLRSKAEAANAYIRRHPEWSRQFVRYRVSRDHRLTEDKIALLTMIITEGYHDKASVGFTNSQDLLHSQFEKLFVNVYGNVRMGRTGIMSRVWSTEISKDLDGLIPEKAFNESVLQYLLGSAQASARVLRIIGDTEGSILVSLRKAPRNYTVESRIVLASTNGKFRSQISAMLSSLMIGSRNSIDGVVINRKEDIKRFIRIIGFTPGVLVVRRKAAISVWYGKQKHLLSRLALRVYAEQESARTSGKRGRFVNCKTRAGLAGLLMRWYEELEGGER